MLRAILLLALVTSPLAGQWTQQSSGTTASLRGLSVVSGSVAWASGSRGTVVKTTDGGRTWSAVSIPEAATFDLRSIHASSATTAVVAATAGRIWRTTDGGRSWSLRYQATDTTTFLDAIAFSDPRRGLVLGDPIGGRYVLIETLDGGATWRELPPGRRPPALNGEAAFAASGTSMLVQGPRQVWIGSGGTAARVHYTSDAGGHWQAWHVPMHAGASSQGVFALALIGRDLLAVGGDFSRDSLTAINAARLASTTGVQGRLTGRPLGYRSGLAVHAQTAIAVGPAGSDISRNGGLTWSVFDSTGFHAVRSAADGTFFASGSDGRVAVFRVGRSSR